ncbi:MAG TPA: nucleotide exchange factor GrpE [Gemmatimonadales bacterium]|jgi:molecular chaperone GrpE|nr:nucleotide exchange factor GrpE [Gemmatimonadales bacterium]
MTDKKHRPNDAEAVEPTAPTADALPEAPLPVEPPGEAVVRLQAELDALKDRHLRLAAEYDNYRKRMAKERAEAWIRAQAELVQRLADALDDLSRFAHVDPAQTDAKTIHDGVDLVERKMWKELEAAGVTRIDQAGVPFDPAVHEAVTTQPAAAPEQDHTVGQVLQAGYKLRDQLLRPARVVVLTWQGE